MTLLLRLLGLFLILEPLNNPALAKLTTTVSDILDDTDTTASSGVNPKLYDENDSTWKSGIKGPDYHIFPLPINRYFEDFDPEEDGEATRQFKTAYAVVLISRDWIWRQHAMPKGIYQVKLGAYNAGSLKTHLVWEPLPPTEKNKTLRQRLNQRQTPVAMALTLVLKQQGRVKAVLPVNSVEPLKKAERKLSRNTGWVNYPESAEIPGQLVIRGKHFTYQALLH